ncbi:hypothetical protein GILI108418_01290 [Gillisia limnaea]|uniref:Uncharacterized protein n=1 Tax=Gillisia limnaea (strain DSM 15749 / LMG 21470 / R-8282) TaxID=865937 RepID=H2C059_GILLR|nr:hypothetical protein Gilli_2862 [Gillisia limnaea DSM 15749]
MLVKTKTANSAAKIRILEPSTRYKLKRFQIKEIIIKS